MQHPITGDEVKTDLISLRLNEEEQDRYEKLLLKVWERHPTARPADVARSLLGLQDFGLFTQEDLAEFRGRPVEIPHLRANIPKSPKQERQKEAPVRNAPISKKRKTGT